MQLKVMAAFLGFLDGIGDLAGSIDSLPRLLCIYIRDLLRRFCIMFKGVRSVWRSENFI